MSLFSIEVFELSRLNATRVHQGNICECVKMWKEGRLFWKKTKSSRNRNGRKTECWQIVRLLSRYQDPRKNSFPKTRLSPIFSPALILRHFMAGFGCFALKSGFVGNPGTFLKGRLTSVKKFYVLNLPHAVRL